MITSIVPETWEELEQAVAEVLVKSGLEVELHRVVRTVRGDVEIDVAAVQRVNERKLTLFCECKHWRSKVPQAIVHSFRTVVADSGANAGYIISMAGFQAGAHEAVASTNVKLLTWTDFQLEFEPDYYDCYFRRALQAYVDSLCSYTEPISPATFLNSGRLPEENIPPFLKLIERYHDFAFLCLPQFPGMDMLGRGRIKLPLSATIPNAQTKFPPELLNVPDYEGFIERARVVSRQAISEFEGLLRPLRDTCG